MPGYPQRDRKCTRTDKQLVDEIAVADQHTSALNVDGSPAKEDITRLLARTSARAETLLNQWLELVEQNQQAGLSFLWQHKQFKRRQLKPATGPAGSIWECEEGGAVQLELDHDNDNLTSFDHRGNVHLVKLDTVPILLAGRG